jgi:hypothetical protein
MSELRTLVLRRFLVAYDGASPAVHSASAYSFVLRRSGNVQAHLSHLLVCREFFQKRRSMDGPRAPNHTDLSLSGPWGGPDAFPEDDEDVDIDILDDGAEFELDDEPPDAGGIEDTGAGGWENTGTAELESNGAEETGDGLLTESWVASGTNAQERFKGWGADLSLGEPASSHQGQESEGLGFDRTSGAQEVAEDLFSRGDFGNEGQEEVHRSRSPKRRRILEEGPTAAEGEVTRIASGSRSDGKKNEGGEEKSSLCLVFQKMEKEKSRRELL